jgi:hypothetical protein
MEKKKAKVKTKLGDVELAKLMRKVGATATPNESTYIATAQEQAMRGERQAAMDTMQYSIKNPALNEIREHDSRRGADVGNQIVKNVQERMKKRRQGK